MKLIDWEKKGNVVRYYFGDDKLEKWHGDDWDDYPYECNAGRVYDEFIKEYIDIAYPYDYLVVEPQDDWTCDGGSNYSKDDLIAKKAPCIVIANSNIAKEYYNVEEYRNLAIRMDTLKIYLGDNLDKIEETGIKIASGTVDELF